MPVTHQWDANGRLDEGDRRKEDEEYCDEGESFFGRWEKERRGEEVVVEEQLDYVEAIICHILVDGENTRRGGFVNTMY